MNNKTLLMAAFALVVLAQWYVPAKMIWDKEDVIEAGVLYKFRTAPVDPNDPFRGKYIVLNFEANRVPVENTLDWVAGAEAYVSFATDGGGFALPVLASVTPPTDHHDYLKTTVRYVATDGSNQLTIDYPFDRFYMNENKAYDAEQLYNRLQRNNGTTTYALVRILDGEAVLQDVMIDGVSIKDAVEE